MKLLFEDQAHQGAAIAAVTDLFEGALQPPADIRVGQAPGADGHTGFGLDHGHLKDNLQEVTSREAVAASDELQLMRETDFQGVDRTIPNFSVEMETGTGKTYVYIATALRLAERHGLRKFVILVHSVAIRAGVIKTFEQTAEHFRAKYPGIHYRWGVLGKGPALDDFVEPSGTVQFLVVSVQAIDKPGSNAVYQQEEQPQLWNDVMTGISNIANTRPVVIIDEPQNMASPLRRRAIVTLNPLFALRYSATHREPYNLIHRLGPREAVERGLVKRVSVKGVVGSGSGGPYLLVQKVRSRNRRMMAEVVMDRATASGIKRVETVLQPGDDLFEESERIEAYRNMVVDRFERKPDRLILEGERSFRVGEEIGVDRLAIWRDQVRHTIRQHLVRQDEVDASGRSIKVLSLFFVERVADYIGDEAGLPAMFDELFQEEWVRRYGEAADCPDPSDLRVHYFPSTKRGIYKDTKGNADDAEFEARAYEEIIANKNLILTRDNPRAFIFSHSALREGWDNPNVFQVCFLRHTRSENERRQLIGRGLRLPVDDQGRRVVDPGTCRLTLVIDESFSAFRDGVNAEYAATGGGRGSGEGPELEDVDQEVTIRRREEKFTSSEFAELWRRIRHKARYRVTIDATTLPAAVAASEYLTPVLFLANRANVVEGADLVYDDSGQVVTSDGVVVEGRGETVSVAGRVLPDLVRGVEDQLATSKYPLQVTRPTLVSILDALPQNVKRRAINDPDRWARIVAHAIRTVTIEKMVDHIGYEPLPEGEWWDAEVVFLASEKMTPPPQTQGSSPQRGVEPAPDPGANLFDHKVYDSDVERKFATLLENDRDRVKLFTKLPRRFRVRTPVGDYSPDWAIVIDDDGTERLYLVRETKDKSSLDDLEWDVKMRILFARQHFAIAPNGSVDYGHTTAQLGLQIRQDTCE